MPDHPFIIDAHGCAAIPDELTWAERMRTCCFTGHRRKDLPDGGRESSPAMQTLRRLTEENIRIFMSAGVDTFITGMSSGFDILAADILMNTPDIAPKIKLICAVPYIGQNKEMKTENERRIYSQAAEKAWCTVVFFGKYTDGCYKIRNQFMVNCSSAIIGYLRSRDLTASGSAQTLRMAQKNSLAALMIYKDQIDEALKGQGTGNGFNSN